MLKSFIAFSFTCLVFGLLAGCGGDGFTGGTTSGTGSGTGSGTTGTSTAANIQLSASTTSIGTGSSGSVTLSAIVKDSANNLLPDEAVTFSSTGGALQVTAGTTSSTGTATATLTTTGDPTNRTITVTATVDGTTVSDSVDITVSGTAITISGSNTLAVGDTTDLTIFIKDSTSTGIANQSYTVASSNSSIASLSSTTSTTNNSGQAIVSVTGVSAGTATITVTALGLTQTYSINITNDTFSLSAPTSAQEVNINTTQTVTLNWTASGVAQSGKTISFSSTRGSLSANTATTDASGAATVTITSNNVGPATLSATDATTGLTTSVDFEFVVPPVNVNTIDLQADKTTIGPNGDQSVITATARDANNNLVKNVNVLFSITQDNSGGSITNASDITSSLGRASTIYTSTAATTAKDGVHIHAQVSGADCAATPGLCNDINLTVAQSQLFIVLGTSNLMTSLDNTRYQKQWNVLVTDSSGNAVANTQVNLSIIPTYYYIGQYFWDDTVTSWLWYPGNATPTSGDTTNSYKCINEDFSRDGVLDAGEDLNNNEVLDPRNVATVAGTVTTDSYGYAVFEVTWAKQYATWVNVLLTATASVSGTESSSSTTFNLPILAEDLKNKSSMPAQVSPWYGMVVDNAVAGYSTCFRDVSYVPQNVAAIPSSTAGQVNVQWDSLTGAASYNLYYSTASGSGTGPAATKVAGVTSSYAVTGLSTGSLYYFVITAVVNGQETAISSEAVATAP